MWCIEFQRRVLFQLSTLPKELAEVKKLVERLDRPGTFDTQPMPDHAVRDGPIDSIDSFHELVDLMQDETNQQYLVCIINFFAISAVTIVCKVIMESSMQNYNLSISVTKHFWPSTTVV